MENKEGEVKEKHCHSRPQTLTPPHSLLASSQLPSALPSLLKCSLFRIWAPFVSLRLVSCHLLIAVTSTALICTRPTLFLLYLLLSVLLLRSLSLSLSVHLSVFLLIFPPTCLDWTWSCLDEADRACFVASEAWLCDNETRRTWGGFRRGHGPYILTADDTQGYDESLPPCQGIFGLCNSFSLAPLLV